MMRAAAAAPDHGRLRPTRFIALRGPAKEAFGSVLERGYLQRCGSTGTEPDPKLALKERTKLARAPLVLVAATTRTVSLAAGHPNPAAAERGAPPTPARPQSVVTGPEGDRIPWEERRLSTAAAIENLMLAATSLGYGSMWRTGEVVDDPVVKAALRLAVDDDIVGFVYLGTAPPDVRLPPRKLDTDGMLREWSPA